MIAVVTPSNQIYEEVSDHIGHFEDIERLTVDYGPAHSRQLEDIAKSEAHDVFSVISPNENARLARADSLHDKISDLYSDEDNGMPTRDETPGVMVVESGLFVPALGGFPGPHTRYVEETLGVENLWQLFDVHEVDRAIFRSAVAYVSDHTSETFRGRTVGGVVEPRGDPNQGVDRLFEVEGQTFAEMDIGRKNMISPLSRALTKFADWKAGNDLHGDTSLI